MFLTHLLHSQFYDVIRLPRLKDYNCVFYFFLIFKIQNTKILGSESATQIETDPVLLRFLSEVFAFCAGITSICLFNI